MSRYEVYSEAAKYYDKTRVPVGGEILIGVLALSRQSRSEFRLLDAGCGTGAYSELVLPHVDHIDAIDINPDMLAVGRKRFADITSMRCPTPALPSIKAASRICLSRRHSSMR